MARFCRAGLGGLSSTCRGQVRCKGLVGFVGSGLILCRGWSPSQFSVGVDGFMVSGLV